MIAIVALDLKEYSSQQLQVLMISNMVYLVYIGKNYPFVDRADNKFEFLNEFALGMVTIYYVIFTDFCPNKFT